MSIGIVRTLASKIAGPVLIYIVVALGLGMLGTGIYIKYLKNRNLDLLQTVAGLGGMLNSAENDKEKLREDLIKLNNLLTEQRTSYDVIDKNTWNKLEEIRDEEVIGNEFTPAQLDRMRMW